MMVSDPSGQGAEGLHLLGMAKLVFQVLQLGDVLHLVDEVERCAVIVTEEDLVHHCPYYPSVPVEIAFLQLGAMDLSG